MLPADKRVIGRRPGNKFVIKEIIEVKIKINKGGKKRKKRALKLLLEGTQITRIRDILMKPNGATVKEMALIYNNRKDPVCAVHQAIRYLQDVHGYVIVYREIKKVRVQRGRSLYRYNICQIEEGIKLARDAEVRSSEPEIETSQKTTLSEICYQVPVLELRKVADGHGVYQIGEV